jgi:hypothetical protein
MRVRSDHVSIFVALVLAAGIAAGIAVNAGTGWDFADFYDAGHKAATGQIRDLYNPDAAIEGRPAEAQLPFWGTPLSAYLLAPLAWMRPAVALVIFKIENTLALLLGLGLLYRYNRRFAESAPQYRALFMTAVLLFQPFWTIYRVGGQTTPTVFLAFVLAMICYTSGRFLPAAACLVLAVAIKPAFILMLVFLAAVAGLRFLACVVAAGVAAGGVSILLAGWPIHERFLERLSTGWISPWFFNSSLSVFIDNLRGIAGLQEPWYGPASLLVRSAAGLAVIVGLVQSRRLVWEDNARRHFQFSMAILFGLFLMPIVWEHYLSMLFIPLSYLLVFIRKLSRPVQAIVGLIFAFCFTQNVVLIMWLRNHLPDTHALWLLMATALFKSAPLLLFTILLWWQRKRVFATYEIKNWKLL